MAKPDQRSIRKIKSRVRGDLVPALRGYGRLHLPPRKVAQDKTPMAPAYYVGWQEGANKVTGFSLYTLMEEIPGHPQWSTVSGRTLEAAGFRLPPGGIGPEHDRSLINNLKNTVESTRTAA